MNGLATLLGPEYLDGVYFVCGLLPVEVDVSPIPDPVGDWVGYMRAIFGVDTSDDTWWFNVTPERARMHKKLAGSLNEFWERCYKFSSGMSREKFAAVVQWQFAASPFVPARVVDTPCSVCAERGSWTITMKQSVYYDDEDGGMRRRVHKPFSLIMPNDYEARIIRQSHLDVESKIFQRLEEAFNLSKKDYLEEVPDEMLDLISFGDFSDQGDQAYEEFMEAFHDPCVSEVMAEIAEAHTAYTALPSRIVKDVCDATDKYIPDRVGSAFRTPFGNVFESLWDTWQEAVGKERQNRSGMYWHDY